MRISDWSSDVCSSDLTGSYRIGNYDTGEEVDRKRISLSYDFASPDRRDILDEANVIAYWPKQTLNNTEDAIRDPDPRGFIPGGQIYDRKSTRPNSSH